MKSSINLDTLQGVWKRDWIEADGKRHHTTTVLWAQAQHLFVDIRIPAIRPDIGAHTCLADLSTQDLAQLKAAEGFAGVVDLQNSVCTWHREINWHGPPREIDAGALSFDTTGRLIETGVHAPYAEQWQHWEATPFHAQRIHTDDLEGILLFSDKYFFLGMGVPVNLQPAADNGAQNNMTVVDLFSSEYVFGHWDGHVGTSELSTNPFNEQTKVLSKESDVLLWSRQNFHGRLITTPLQSA